LFVWMQNSIFSVLQRCPIPRRPCARPPTRRHPAVNRVQSPPLEALSPSTTSRAVGGAAPSHVSQPHLPLPHPPLHNSSRCRGGGTSLSFSCNQGMLRRHRVGGRACAQYGLLCHGCGGANKEDLDRSCLCRRLRCRSLHRAAGRPTHQGKRVAGWQRASGRRGPAVRHDVGRVKLPCTADGERERRATAPDSAEQRRQTKIAHPSSGATLNYAGPPVVR
jgi:hypothetical protein